MKRCRRIDVPSNWSLKDNSKPTEAIATWTDPNENAFMVIDIFEREKIIERLPPRIAYLAARLEEFRRLAHVSDVRQWGYMVGIELVENKDSRQSYAPENRIGYKVILEARKRNVMIRPLGDVIVLMPPLSIAEDELTSLVDVVYESIVKVTGH